MATVWSDEVALRDDLLNFVIRDTTFPQMVDVHVVPFESQ
jgi:hypothetical protein